MANLDAHPAGNFQLRGVDAGLDLQRGLPGDAGGVGFKRLVCQVLDRGRQVGLPIARQVIVARWVELDDRGRGHRGLLGDGVGVPGGAMSAVTESVPGVPSSAAGLNAAPTVTTSWGRTMPVAALSAPCLNGLPLRMSSWPSAAVLKTSTSARAKPIAGSAMRKCRDMLVNPLCAKILKLATNCSVRQIRGSTAGRSPSPTNPTRKRGTHPPLPLLTRRVSRGNRSCGFGFAKRGRVCYTGDSAKAVRRARNSSIRARTAGRLTNWRFSR